MSSLTAAHLRAIAGPKARPEIIGAVAELAPKMLPTYGLDRPHCLAHFVAQIAHESDRFATTREYASGAAYEGRKDLGNTQPGDGTRFRGRALIQNTGRYNYTKFTEWCRINKIDAPDFVAEPAALEKFPWELLSSCWYWDFGNPTRKSLNAYADANNIEAITRKINGGLNGYHDRISLYSRTALVLLGYPMEKGVIARFQRDAGFTGSDVDDIAGMKTRAAMHTHLMGKPRLWIVAPPVPAPVEPQPPTPTPPPQAETLPAAFVAELAALLHKWGH